MLRNPDFPCIDIKKQGLALPLSHPRLKQEPMTPGFPVPAAVHLQIERGSAKERVCGEGTRRGKLWIRRFLNFLPR